MVLFVYFGALSSCGSVVVTHNPSCPAACGILSDQRLNLHSPKWQVDSQPLNHQGSPSWNTLLSDISFLHWLGFLLNHHPIRLPILLTALHILQPDFIIDMNWFLYCLSNTYTHYSIYNYLQHLKMCLTCCRNSVIVFVKLINFP